MKTVDLKKIRKAMEKQQDAKRYEHTLGVAYTATALAMKYGVSLKDAQLAGLLHDCAKCLSDKKKLSICEKHGLPVSEVEMRNPFLLHAKVGGFLARKEYLVQDEDIINAILYHTTGRPDMSTIEKIIFIADYIEPGRKEAPNLTQLRQMAFEDLDSTLIGILKDTLAYLEKKGGEMDPMTRNTYEYYCKESKEV
ncbi:MAG: bis(5'-nucleosyl)-tetraphosphatase (symmetrical) YqeK [Lachnospiraceae bacterium]|nr:bis(5'-nucleosyl)-tetraphosphatase (symmetrical) YqeK [Lachnospiraceae bacterium]